MYNRVKIAEVLQDLRKRKEDEKRKAGVKDYRMSFVKLSKEIDDKTGVKISHTALWEYEKDNGQKKMSIEFLCALADYYKVSTDYLLGLADEPSPIIEIQAITKILGLSEEAMVCIHSITDVMWNYQKTIDEEKNIKSESFTLEPKNILNEILTAEILTLLITNMIQLTRDYSSVKENEPTFDTTVVEKFPDSTTTDLSTATKAKYTYQLWLVNTTGQKLIYDVLESYYLKNKDGIKMYTRDYR